MKDRAESVEWTMNIYVIYSRANAPTGSAGEESVSWWWLLLLLLLLVLVLLLLLLLMLLLLLLLLLHGVLLAHTRAARARAKHARKYWLIWRTYTEGRFGSPQTNQKNHGIYDVFAASEKIKLKIRIAKKTKTLYFTMFLARRVPKLAFRKALKHRCLQCFGPPPKRKQRYVRCFLTLGTPKWSRNNGIHDVFAIAKKVFLQNAWKQKVT